MVQVKDYKTEPSVILVTERLDVVSWPVLIAQIEFYGHVVGILLNVYNLTDASVGFHL